jgi:hypothetical protein
MTAKVLKIQQPSSGSQVRKVYMMLRGFRIPWSCVGPASMSSFELGVEGSWIPSRAVTEAEHAFLTPHPV